MNLPILILKFWYPQALVVFIRVWSNFITLLEEDLAVGLMWRLLFVPLFHDTTFFGRIMSFFFRLGRVLLGALAMFLVTVIICVVAVVWFVTPIGLLLSLFAGVVPGSGFYENLRLLLPVFIFGLALFLNNIFNKPLKKIWHLKTLDQIWACTRLKKDQTQFNELLTTDEVKKLLLTLEIKNVDFRVDETLIDNQKFLERVFKLCKMTQTPYVTAGYFFVSLLQFVPQLEQQLLKQELSIEDFEKALLYMEDNRLHWRKVFIWDDDFSVKHLKGVNRGWLGAPTPVLDAVCEDLTRMASLQKIEDFVGREQVVTQVIRILSQEHDRNAMLIGEVGSGRSTLVSFLAKKIISGDAPDILATKRIVRLDISKLISGVQNEGDAALRIKEALDEAKSIENIIIFVPEIHNLGLGDAAKNYNLFGLITSGLEASTIQFIASTDESNYSKILEKNSSLAHLFHKVEVPPASHDETLEILFRRAVEKVSTGGCEFTYLALKEIVTLSEKLIHDRVLPDSALFIFEEASALKKNPVTTTDIKRLFTEQIHTPLIELDQTQKQTLLNLESIIHERLIDQTEAVKAISDTLRRSATQIRESGRPIGSFLFVGPTGVGKTELAKILAEVYFKDNEAYLRFDMSEFQSIDSLNRLLGTNETPGVLTEEVKRRPYSLLLLDEFEKADPRVLTLFLQILDDGRLTGGDGKTVDFSNTIIIATSNSESLLIAEGIKNNKPFSEIEASVKDELIKNFKPELINRFDGVVIFKPLKREELDQIVTIKLEGLKELMREQGYDIEFTPSLINMLSQQGFDPLLGARPLRRLMQDGLEANLSKLILKEELKKGEKFIVDINLLS